MMYIVQLKFVMKMPYAIRKIGDFRIYKNCHFFKIQLSSLTALVPPQ